MADWAGTLGAAMGLAWLSGINLYAAVATLGLLERLREPAGALTGARA